MDHYMKPLDKKEIDKILRQIRRERPDLDTLEKNEMVSLSHIGHLYVLDNVTLKELSAFWGISKNAVRKRLKEKVISKSWFFKIAEKSQKAEIKLCPSEAFPDIGEYINFLKWRSACKKETSISITEVVAILGISKPTVYRYIRIGELHVCGTDGNRIMRFSFNLLVQKTILETEIKLNIMKDYIHRKRRNSNVPDQPSVPSLVKCDTLNGTLVPSLVKRDTLNGTLVPSLVKCDTLNGTLVPSLVKCDTLNGTLVPSLVKHDTINGT
jgi:hypothetical protein